MGIIKIMHAMRLSSCSFVLRIAVFLAGALWLYPFASQAAWSGTDEEFVAMVESNNWDFFRRNQGGPYRFFRGSGLYDSEISSDAAATCAGDGFGIASLCVGAYRGWTSDEYAYTNILALLRAYDTQLQRDGNNFFNHFYGYEDGLPKAEYSVIDSTWFLCGAIMAAQYFKGTEVETLANRIYDSCNYAAIGPLWAAYYEYIIINIVGSGSRSNAWGAATAQASWESCTRASSEYMHGPLFWYQWPQVYVDFRFRTDSLGSNHYQLAMNAFLDQQRKCIDLHNAFPAIYDDFGTNGWGLTSAGASLGYLELRPWGDWCTGTEAYGTPGCWYMTNYIATDEEACDSGTLSPICLPACMEHTPYEAREAMKHIYNQYDPSINVYGMYSFMNSFNTGQASSGYEHFSVCNAAMDYGANVLALENFRSGMPWKYFMAHRGVTTGMLHCGFTTPDIPYHDDWNDGSDANAWNGDTTYTNTDGGNPTANYVSIPYFTNWVNGQARRLQTTGAGTGDIVRIQLNEADQSKQDELSFWLRGENGGERFDVGLRDAEGHEIKFAITNHVPDGTVSTNWFRVRIPLKSYAVSGNPNNDVRLTFLGDFSVQFAQPGVVYIEDLAFVGDDIAPDPPSLGAACVDGRVYLRWGYSAQDDVVGYNLRRGSDAGSNYTNLNASLLSAVHEEIDSSVESDWGGDYFYSVQCQDRCGNVGLFSSGPSERRVWIGRHRDLDWGDGQNPNTLGGNDGTWGGSWRSITFERQMAGDGRSNWVRRCTADAGCGVYVELNGGDVSSYDALVFLVKKEWGVDRIELGLKSTNFTEVKVALTNYVSGGVISGTWNPVIIPLIDFPGVDFANMNNLSFTFLSGASLLFDEIRFVRVDMEPGALFVREAEKAGGHLGGSINDFKPYASEGRVLGEGWATNAGDDVWFAPDLAAAPNEAYLDVRYACAAAPGRALRISVNDEYRAGLIVSNTGGWGDEAWHFREDTIRLGRITNTSFLLKLSVTNAGTAVNLDRIVLRSAGRYFREAEDWDAQTGSGGVDLKSGASGGEVLGSSWGGAAGSYAVYSNVVIPFAISNAVLCARYGQDWNDGRLIRVRLNGADMGRMAFANTHGWLEHWSDGAISELPLGVLTSGVYTLRLESEGADESVNLDWVCIEDRLAVIHARDSDDDGISDIQENLYGTSLTAADSDNDGLTDLEEISLLGGHLTDPLDGDSDDDSMSDGDEEVAGTDPNDIDSLFEFLAFDPQPLTNGSIRLQWCGSAAGAYDIQYCDGDHSDTNAFKSVTDPERITVEDFSVTYIDDGSGTTPRPDDPSVRQRNYRIRAYAPAP